MKQLPILLLTGYLGSGKTTLVNHILTNTQGIKFAVIVNDLGEVNIDANLIEKGGVVGKKDDSLVALQNGCICCTLKMDLVEQISDIMAMNRFDYLVIEASGICEPLPIAQTICTIKNMGEEYTQHGIPRLDCVCAVVDALRMRDEFDCGGSLKRDNIDEEDIENLLIQQIEFCNLVLLNKASEVSDIEREHLYKVIRALQPSAKIIECDYCDVPLTELLNTHLFNLARVANSAGWIQVMDNYDGDEDEYEDEHEHEHHHDEHHEHEHEHEHGHEHEHEHEHEHGHHHHHHHHGEGEAEEYGIGTFVYYRRRPLDLNKFDYYVATKWPENVIRAKGVCYFDHNTDMSYLFEQAGRQKQLSEAGLWYATAPAEELAKFMAEEPGLRKDWDETYGDRMQKIVFIGRNLDKEQIARDLDACLV